MANTRRCNNWLKTFQEWAAPRSEAKESFLFWTGLFTLSSALRRRVQVPKKYLGGWAAPPNLYVIFVAPPAKGRKTTTANYADDLLEDVPGVQRASSAMSVASLLNKLSENSNDASMSIFSGEFSTFLSKSNKLDMFDVLTDLFDGKKSISTDIISRPFEFAEKPCINLLAATTPGWVAENMPESVIGGGFASRVIFIYEETVRRRQLFYNDLIDWPEMGKLYDMLKEDLIHIATNIAGDFEITKEAQDYAETWYKKNADAMPPEQYKMHGYFERKPAHMFKVAQLYHISYSDELILNVEDFRFALGVLGEVEKTLPKVFQGVGKNKYVLDIDRINDYIQEKAIVNQKELLKHFSHVATPSLLGELIGGLIAIGSIELAVDPDSKEVIYIAKGDS